MKKKKISIAADHAGHFLKEKIKSFLISEKYEIKDFGSFSEESVDYPDYAHPMAISVANGDFDLGISVCATGNGINMTVNKHQGIRGALCWNEEISKMTRAHNDANICSIPGKYISESEALLIVKTFITTEFEGGRHKRRIDKIPVKIY